MSLVSNAAIIILLIKSTIKEIFAHTKKGNRMRRQYFLLCSSLFLIARNINIFNRESFLCSFSWEFLFKCMWGYTHNLSLSIVAHCSRLQELKLSNNCNPYNGQNIKEGQGFEGVLSGMIALLDAPTVSPLHIISSWENGFTGTRATLQSE